MSTINVIGVDPGAIGALFLLKLNSAAQPRIYFMDNKAVLSVVHNWLTRAGLEMNIRMSMIENVHSIQGTSAKSNFNFGRNVGTINTLLDLQDFGKDLVTPKTWQKFAGIPAKPKGTIRTSAQLKKLVAETCERLYPGCDIRGPKGGLLDGRSDALMIAHYCAHKYMGQTE